MKLIVTILSSFSGADIRPNTEDQVRKLDLDVPDHLLERFRTAFGGFVRKEMQASDVDDNDLTVVIPHRMSWDPVFRVKGWFADWQKDPTP